MVSAAFHAVSVSAGGPRLNDYKAKRSRAMVMQAECLVKMNDALKAVLTGCCF